MAFTLLIRDQDIHFCEIGLGKEDVLLREKKMNLSPEDLLHGIVDTLNEWKIPFQEIDRIMVVTGPGSCTASRVSVTIANTLAFSHGLSLMAGEASYEESLEEIWQRIRGQEGRPLTVPAYTSQPHITSFHS